VCPRTVHIPLFITAHRNTNAYHVHSPSCLSHFSTLNWTWRQIPSNDILYYVITDNLHCRLFTQPNWYLDHWWAWGHGDVLRRGKPKLWRHWRLVCFAIHSAITSHGKTVGSEAGDRHRKQSKKLLGYKNSRRHNLGGGGQGGQTPPSIFSN
jgi:hypothetical protein